jgi:hypothetical protein
MVISFCAAVMLCLLVKFPLSNQAVRVRLPSPVRCPIVTVIKRKPGSIKKTVAPIGILVAYYFPILLPVDCVCLLLPYIAAS